MGFVAGEPSAEIRELQRVELGLFKKFADFAAEYGIEYFALGGTLLGAVRHKGFIPWDDDMDIGLPREDYDRLLELCAAVEVPFELHHHLNDSACMRYFARLEDPSVRVLRVGWDPPEVTSAWIDVFPLDGMPSNFLAQYVQKFRILYRRTMFRCATPGKPNNLSEERPWYERVLICAKRILPLHKVLGFDRQWHKLDRCLRRYSYTESDYLVNALGHWKFREMFPKSCYGEGVDYEFEDTTIHGPVDFDTVCTQLYGDYMTPVNMNHHHLVSVDMDGSDIREKDLP